MGFIVEGEVLKFILGMNKVLQWTHQYHVISQQLVL